LRRGVKIVQLRAKELNKAEYLRLAKKIARAAKAKGATFLLNDHWPLVRAAGADGVHLGWDDLQGVSLTKIRRAIGEDKLIGLSAQNYNEAKRAARLKPDYIGFGPVFATPLKPGVKAAGLKSLQQVVDKIKVPIVAIGGINRTNVAMIKEAGCQRYAAIRGLAGLSGQRV
ncbi:MAG TPA: thiamine phosphate synthase, partial [Candidatus Sulfotelmatobacter sp.]|nr:thiamine phosphate synthase [Candidatus Sulfotelmatobacter sp.]